MYACVVDREGHKPLHRNFANDDPATWLAAIEPFRQHHLVVGCESTFNWYWLCPQINSYMMRMTGDRAAPPKARRPTIDQKPILALSACVLLRVFAPACRFFTNNRREHSHKDRCCFSQEDLPNGLLRDSLCYPQRWAVFRRGLLPRREPNQVVTPKASVKQRAREFGYGCGRDAGSAALAGDEQRTLASREVGANPCQHWGNDKRREFSLSASCVHWLVGGNSACGKSSPNATLFITILCFAD